MGNSIEGIELPADTTNTEEQTLMMGPNKGNSAPLVGWQMKKIRLYKNSLIDRILSSIFLLLPAPGRNK